MLDDSAEADNIPVQAVRYTLKVKPLFGWYGQEANQTLQSGCVAIIVIIQHICTAFLTTLLMAPNSYLTYTSAY